MSHDPGSMSAGFSDPAAGTRRLLILGCSKAKTMDDGLIPAWQRYDGPAFRVLRRYLRQRQDPALSILVLSAEYGIVAADSRIPYYDRQMTPTRAGEIRHQVSATLSHLLNGSDFLPEQSKHVLVVLGREYLGALTDYTGNGSDWLINRRVLGRPGERLAQLKAWLNAESPT